MVINKMLCYSCTTPERKATPCVHPVFTVTNILLLYIHVYCALVQAHDMHQYSDASFYNNYNIYVYNIMQYIVSTDYALPCMLVA